jgi:hypothetical protein
MVCEFSPCEAMLAQTGFEHSNIMRYSRRTNGSNGFLDESFRVEFDCSLCDSDCTAHGDCGDAPRSGQLEQRGTENSSRLDGHHRPGGAPSTPRSGTAAVGLT